MSENIHWVLEVAILPGKLDDFRAVSRDLIAATESEPGTFTYEWYFNADQTICHVHERFRDSEAVITHDENFGRFAERFLQASRPVRFDIYGTPSEKVKAMLADFHPAYFTKLGGFSR